MDLLDLNQHPGPNCGEKTAHVSEGFDSFANVEINGVTVLATNKMFLAWRVDATKVFLQTLRISSRSIS
jgi:beta-galactosidase/beta-glucuronidase